LDKNLSFMKKIPLNLLVRFPAIFAAVLIWFLSSQSILPKPKGIFGYDKLQHLLAFAVLSGGVGLWVPPDKWKDRGLLFMFITAGIGSAYGIVDEVHQFFVPGRDCNVWDWIADTLGAMIGAAAAAFICPRLLIKSIKPVKPKAVKT
jgi:VanZ family protein